MKDIIDVSSLGYTPGVVPCDGCVSCCLRDAVRLLPEDDASKFETRPHPYFPGQLALKHKVDHRGVVCHYLGESGCMIQADKPKMCSDMDCRTIIKRFSSAELRKLINQGKLARGVVDKGRQLIARLK